MKLLHKPHCTLYLKLSLCFILNIIDVLELFIFLLATSSQKEPRSFVVSWFFK